MNRKKIIGAIASCVVLLIFSGGVAFFLGWVSVDQTPPNPSTPAASSIAAPAGGTNYPGAMVGNTQRSWPDPSGMIDDSRHSHVGEYSVDPYFQRPVWTPIQHDGDFPTSVVSGGWEECADPSGIVFSGKTQQQYVNARYLVVNDEAGPSRLDRGVPRGYAHSPQGAVLAAMNIASYGSMRQGDEIGEEIDKAIWTSSKSYQEANARRKIEWTQERMQNSRADLVPAITHYRITTCGEKAMVVDVVVNLPAEVRAGQVSRALRIPLFWRNSDWVPDFTGIVQAQETVPVEDITQFLEVKYQ